MFTGTIWRVSIWEVHARISAYWLFRSMVNGSAQRAFPVHHTHNSAYRFIIIDDHFNDPRS